MSDVCRGLGISEATFYNWKKKYDDLAASEICRQRQLEEENARLKRVVADLTLDKHILQDVIRKSLTPTRRREVVQWILDVYQVSVQRACRLGQFSSGSWYRKSRARDQSALRMRIRDIAMSRPRFGYERIHILLRREGWQVNLKRVHRLYCLEGLQARMRVRRNKRLSLHRGPAPQATGVWQRWSMDFVHDQLADGRAFRVLTVVDNWSRESPVLEAGFRLTGDSVVQVLERVAKRVPLPASITVDHGTEFTSKSLDFWAWENKVLL
ncbi:MAG: IS3 family transposase, partial [Corticimicrobacter sp.]|uniref:IS3 family transposase n=1 Tax=Corticimicrobacter sp. TaxID=2678536 RepID=UPI0032D9CB7E